MSHCSQYIKIYYSNVTVKEEDMYICQKNRTKGIFCCLFYEHFLVIKYPHLLITILPSIRRVVWFFCYVELLTFVD